MTIEHAPDNVPLGSAASTNGLAPTAGEASGSPLEMAAASESLATAAAQHVGGVDEGVVGGPDGDSDNSITDVEEEEVEELDEVEDDGVEVQPLEFIDESAEVEEDLQFHWYILKVQVNREDSIRDALQRRVKIEGLERYFQEIVVPTEDVAEFTKTGKRRIVKRKMYPGYIMVNMAINDDSWFIVRETPGIGDFTGAGGKPTPMESRDVDRILKKEVSQDEEGAHVKTSIPFSVGDRVRVKDGNFQNFEGDVDKIDETRGLITVVIPIFSRATPVEIPYWQIEKI